MYSLQTKHFVFRSTRFFSVPLFHLEVAKFDVAHAGQNFVSKKARPITSAISLSHQSRIALAEMQSQLQAPHRTTFPNPHHPPQKHAHTSPYEPKMSGAIGKAAQQVGKAAGKASEGSSLTKGARRDPELIVCFAPEAPIDSQTSIVR